MSKLTLHLKDKAGFQQIANSFFCCRHQMWRPGEEVILDSGYLPQAISASAAIPTLVQSGVGQRPFAYRWRGAK